jgi:hypothetical protein
MKAAGVRGDAGEVTRERVVVAGLGTAPIVEVAVSAPTPGDAQRLTGALAAEVTKALNSGRLGGLADVLRSIQDRLTELGQKRAPLAAAAQSDPRNLVAQNNLAGINRQIDDLSAQYNKLSLDAAAAGTSTVIDAPARPSAPESSGATQRLGLAVLLGLAIGILIAAAIETVRPTIPGAQRVGRLLGVPLLGRLGAPGLGDLEVGRRVRLAARRAGVRTVVLLGANPSSPLEDLAHRLRPAILVAGPLREAPDRPGSSNGAAPNGSALGDGTTISTLLHAPPRELVRELRRVCTLNALEADAESASIGVVLLTGSVTRVAAVTEVQNLVAAAGWPVLGVVDEGRHGRRYRR